MINKIDGNENVSQEIIVMTVRITAFLYRVFELELGLIWTVDTNGKNQTNSHFIGLHWLISKL